MSFFNENELEAVEEGLEPYLEEFLAARKKDFLRLQELYLAHDYTTMCKIVHSWKGFCAPYGFAHLGQMAKKLESFLKAEDEKMSVQCLSQIELYLKHKDIQNLIHQTPSESK